LVSSPIKIFINGDLKKFPSETNIVSVLESLNISSKHIAIEINENLVFRSDWQETNLKDGDKVEIVKAIGGG
jgi:sulfur carrier protein|tara:strand:- start:1676 stop:1891 length:216 start_codon:yes stop_codon:yes gene_type:complete